MEDVQALDSEFEKVNQVIKIIVLLLITNFRKRGLTGNGKLRNCNRKIDGQSFGDRR